MLLLIISVRSILNIVNVSLIIEELEGIIERSILFEECNGDFLG